MADAHEPYPEVDDGSSPGPFSSGSVQDARWQAMSVPAVTDAVREALGTALRRGVTLATMPELSVKGLPTREGFVLQVTAPKRCIGVELVLVEVEGMTRVQLSVPVDSQPTDDELRQIAEWVQQAFAKAKWAIR